ncbi:furin-like protease kpc-1 isoform X2 [Ciona intestinalis]
MKIFPSHCSSARFVYFLFSIVLYLSCTSDATRRYFPKRHRVYLNEFAVEIPPDRDANEVARNHGFMNLGQVGNLEGWYIFKDHRIRKRSLETEHRDTPKLKRLKRDVIMVERLRVLKRVKRDPVSITNNEPSPNDPSWDEMWYMHCGNNRSQSCPSSMRIEEAWIAGFHGEGVVVTILDDGLETTHPDLIRNYDRYASIDINDRDTDPTPRYDPSNENKHGTRCAGVVAAVLDNHICIVGVAHGASIGGVRMLDGEVTDRVEAHSLNFAQDRIDIYSASWGPDDDGETVEGPGPLAKAAFKSGAKYGRGGNGSIFVWASGNGGHNKDSCSCDGYINSIYTIGISSVSERGNRPWYLEGCASTLATTYSSGEINEGKVITTDLHRRCTHEHTGTSASAPMAAGIIALMLQANMALTWRDVQHVIVRTTKSQGLHGHDWVVNGAGFNVSHVFGFGLLDAAALTHVAGRWNRVPEQHECITIPQRLALEIVPREVTEVTMDTRACHRKTSEVLYLEHVVLRITLSHPRRGSLKIFLVSPSGTVSNILQRRDYDRSSGGFNDWEFMTTHHWGENPMGVWLLRIEDIPYRLRYREPRRGMLRKWQLLFYGTQTHPQPNFHFNNCDAFPQDHCHSECNGCCGYGPHECRACRHVSTPQGMCIASCDRSQYVEPGSNICKPCWRTCLTCNAGRSQNCTSCRPGFSIVNGACVMTCRPGYFLQRDLRTGVQNCRLCDRVCLTCHHRSSHCTSCRSSFIFHDGQCTPSCGVGTYLVSTSVGCRPCNASCRGCSVYPTRCTTCADGYVLHHQRCVRTCPRQHYPDYRRQTCRRCHPSCKACIGPRNDQCTRCPQKRRLENGQCSLICQDAVSYGGFFRSKCLLVKRQGLCRHSSWAWQCCGTCSARIS